jgi:hypothetical protein
MTRLLKKGGPLAGASVEESCTEATTDWVEFDRERVHEFPARDRAAASAGHCTGASLALNFGSATRQGSRKLHRLRAVKELHCYVTVELVSPNVGSS